MRIRYSVLAIPIMLILLCSSDVLSKSKCPPSVTHAALNAYPGATVISCIQEMNHGKIQHEIKVKTKEKRKVELDVNPEGSILLTEMDVEVDSIPNAAMESFRKKYPKKKVTGSIKQIDAAGVITYEIAFSKMGKKQEVVFDADGGFVEED